MKNIIAIVLMLITAVSLVSVWASNAKSSAKKTPHIFYYKDDTLIQEVNPHEGLLSFLYSNTLGKNLRKLLRRHLASHALGCYYDTSISTKDIEPFIKKHSLDMSEYKRQKPEEFKSFNDFFTRKLKPDARKITNEKNCIISPADSKLFVIENITNKTTFYVKKLGFNLKKFLASSHLANTYDQGTLMIFRLAPYDYHRFHTPVTGPLSKRKVIHGMLESVNPIAYKKGVLPLTENERHLITINSAECGDVAMVPVGAMFVGKIIETYKPNKTLEKGAEVGYFAFGGSTVALLFKKGAISVEKKYLRNSLEGYETAVKMGEVVARATKKNK